MNRLIALLLPLGVLVSAPVPVLASARETIVYEVTTEEWVEGGAERFVAGSDEVIGGAAYGPFRVLDERRAALVGVTDSRSPQSFAALLRDHPEVATLEMIDCPGTFDDLANLELGRMIRREGIATHVPADGSVRSGAVELFLAGRERRIDDGAKFAVHAWEDEDGREATDFSASAPENRKYLSYYQEMGMDAGQAAAFYAMTNSVPFEQARWLDAAEMRGWLPEAHAEPKADGDTQVDPEASLRLAYLDLGAALN